MNRRHVNAAIGALGLLALGALVVVATTDLWAQETKDKRKVAPKEFKLMLPDLVVAAISTSGAPTVVGSNVEVPLTVVVKNQGSAAAGAFKVSVDFSRAGAAPLAVAFSVPGQDLWYPKATGLNGGSSVTFTGKLLFLNSVHGAVSTIAMADSCSGDEFMPEHCRVKESNEANNRSTAVSVTLP